MFWKTKRTFLVLLSVFVFITSGYTAGNPEGPDNNSVSVSGVSGVRNVLVVYFSCTGNTKPLAEYVADELNADLYEIRAKVPYTDDDIKYYTDCRADREQADPSARPEIAGELPDLTGYDTVFLGYPIWHGQAPKIIYTFLEGVNMSGKLIVPFCTSGSSSIGSSATNLHSLTSGAEWNAGKRFAAGTSKPEIVQWVRSIIPEANTMRIKIRINGHEMTATLADNSSGKALYELLKQGNMTVEAHDYGNFEKVGSLPQVLPRNDEEISTTSGDIILYLGSSICFYYSTNSWDFTRLGRIDGAEDLNLKDIYGSGDAVFVLSIL